MRTGALLVLAVACGCGRSERHDKAAKQAPMRNVELPEPAIALPRELAFELLDRGQEPRSIVRYTLEANHAMLLTETSLTTRELDDGTWHEPVQAPPITTKLDIAAGADGKLTLDGSTVVTIDARGRLLDHGSSPDELIQRLLVALVPMPEQAIGTGARWRVVTAFRQQGAVVKQTATYTLTSRAPVEVGVEIQELAERQQVGDTEVVAIVRDLHGSFTAGSSTPLPTRGSLTVKSTVHVRIGGHEHIVEDTGKVEVHMQISSTAE